MLDNLQTWWASQATWREPTWWVLASIGAGVMATWLIWAAHRRSDRLPSPAGIWVSWLLRIAWLLSPGYMALLTGALSPRLMGLTQIDWGQPAGNGILFAAGSLFLLVAATISFRRTGPAPSPWSSWSEGMSWSGRLVAEAGALQWHWAFYRSAAISAAVALGFTWAVYLGTWLAVALVCLEGLLNPMLWRDLRTPGLAQVRLLRLVLLVVSSVLYLLSRNFWLGWALHGSALLLVEPRLRAVLREPHGQIASSPRLLHDEIQDDQYDQHRAGQGKDVP